MDILRTPDDRFANLPEFPFAPRYVEVPAGDGSSLRIHYVDEGDGAAAPVLMLHGEPSWCFLYRKVIPVVRDAGLRAIAPDLVGFGRSDKPTRRSDHTYERHVAWMRGFIEALDLRAITLVCQDWGGLIGLRLVGERPERFARVIAANTALPTGDRRMPEGFHKWRARSQELREFPTGKIVKGGCQRPLSPEVIAAYDAPFPNETFQAGARELPMMVPISPDDPATVANRRAWASLGDFEKPFLTVFGDADPYTVGAVEEMQRRIPGAAHQRHVVLPGVGHFLQEDAGEELGRIIVGAMRGSYDSRQSG